MIHYIKTKETHWSYWAVEANTPDEALKSVENGEGDMIHDEFSHVDEYKIVTGAEKAFLEK